MKNDNIGSLLIAALPPLVGLIGLAINSLGSRSASARRSRAIGEAASLVAFYESWYKAGEQLSAAEDLDRLKSRTKLELERIASDLSATLAAQSSSAAKHSRPLLRRLLLLYKPKNPWAWFLHLIYYFCLLTSLWFLGMFIVALQRPNEATTFLVGLLVFEVFSTIIAAVAHFAARHRDQERLSHEPPVR